MKKFENIVYGKHPSQALDVYLPEKTKAIFVYFHGGGLVCGDKQDGAFFAEDLTEQNIALVSVSYRLYPEAAYPDFIRDAAVAVAWAHRHKNDVFHCDKLYVGGSSAGGYLSMMLCFDAQYLSEVGIDNSVIAGYFHDAGQPTAHFTVLEKKGLDSRRVIVDETSALYHVGLLPSYPPMRFIVSDNDLKNRYEQTMLLLGALDAFGYQGYDHIVMHGGHCEYCGKRDEAGKSVLGQMIADFVKKIEENA